MDMRIDLSQLRSRTAGVVGIDAGRRHATGLVIGDGLVLTTAHAVRGHDVWVVPADGVPRAATSTTTAPDHDLAVAHVDTTDLPALVWGDGTALATGDAIAAIAAPRGTARLTEGVIATTTSAFTTSGGSRVTAVADHTAPLPRGASGGPVLDADGRVVAINANRLDGGLYQAVLVDDVLRAVVDALSEGRSPEPRRLQVSLVHPRRAAAMRASVGLDPRPGVLVDGVAEDGPAGRAGVTRGDLITAVDGAAVTRVDDLARALRGTAPSAVLTLARGGDADTRDVEVSFSAS